jgi:hypothetical protein
LLASSECAISQ